MEGIKNQVKILTDIIVKDRCKSGGCSSCLYSRSYCPDLVDYKRTARKIISNGFLLGADTIENTSKMVFAFERDGVINFLESCAEDLIEKFGNIDADYEIYFNNKDSATIIIKNLFSINTSLSLSFEISCPFHKENPADD